MILRSIFASFTLFLAFAGAASAQAPEVPVRGLGDIAKASIDPRTGTFVVFTDPAIAARSPQPFVVFSKALEQAHIKLGHVDRNLAITTPHQQRWLTAALVTAADCATARTLSDRPDVINAAVFLFKAQGSVAKSATRPAGTDRAANIKRCSESAAQGVATVTPRAPAKPVSFHPQRQTSCESAMTDCVEEIDSFDTCIADMQAKCFDRCDAELVNCGAMCDANAASNVGSWAPKCNARINKEQSKCSSERKTCEGAQAEESSDDGDPENGAE